MTGYLFKLTSQQWLDESIYVIEHDGTVVWKHWVWLWVPTGKSIDPQMVRSAILLIEGGKNGGRPPNESDTYMWRSREATYMWQIRLTCGRFDLHVEDSHEKARGLHEADSQE